MQSVHSKTTMKVNWKTRHTYTYILVYFTNYQHGAARRGRGSAIRQPAKAKERGVRFGVPSAEYGVRSAAGPTISPLQSHPRHGRLSDIHSISLVVTRMELRCVGRSRRDTKQYCWNSDKQIHLLTNLSFGIKYILIIYYLLKCIHSNTNN